jgi:hypothetical protein
MDGRARDQLQVDADILTTLLAEEGVEWSPATGIPARERRQGHRPSFAQQRLWTLHQVYPPRTTLSCLFDCPAGWTRTHLNVA